MVLTRKQKEELVKKITEDFKKTKSVIFTDFTGLKVSEMSQLRKHLRAEKIGYRVIKKTLTTVALEKAGLDSSWLKEFKGSIASAFDVQDEAKFAKILVNFANTHPNLKILGGFLDKEFVESQKIHLLALLPPRQIMLGQFVSTISLPINGLVQLFTGNIRNFIYILSIIKK